MSDNIDWLYDLAVLTMLHNFSIMKKAFIYLVGTVRPMGATCWWSTGL